MSGITFNEMSAKYDSMRSLEWLETNGLGGSSSSTVSGAHTRRYHGLLVAALKPPAERKVLISKLEETIVMPSFEKVASERVALSVNQFPGCLYPEGHKFITHFERNLFPVFHFQVGSVRLKKTIVAVHEENTVLVLYEVIDAPQKFELELLPLYSGRDIHQLSRYNPYINTQYLFYDDTLRVKNYVDLPEIFIYVPGCTFKEEQNWYHNFEYVEEQNYGSDYQEDLYSHGKFSVTLKKGSNLGIIISTNDTKKRDAFKLFEKERKRREKLISRQSSEQIKQLILAADQFLVKREDKLKTVVSGYPWFSDRCRDTMISLPGLCLSTDRHDDAKKILTLYAKYVKEGLLPNHLPAEGEDPVYYNTDTTFWFFYAVYHYYQATNDKRFVNSLLPVFEDIIDWHYKGTHYGIRIDSDELVCSTHDGVPLTWMHAKVGDWVVTPRKGKVVEVNALWYNALCIMDFLMRETNKKTKAETFAGKARLVLESFNRVFWNEEGGYLHDYIDGDYKNSDIRPNQIYAISLPFPLLTKFREAKTFQVIENNLLTSGGLRSLNPSHKDYKPFYRGNIWSRDGAYHQGTAWSFLLGPYIDALIRVRGEEGKPKAQGLMSIFLTHLDEVCIGNISEIFDGEAPHTPRGCIAQAWSVAEILRVALAYNLLDVKKSELEFA